MSTQQEEHIWTKHRVTLADVDDVCAMTRLVIRVREAGYAIYGQTGAGRYLLLYVHPRGEGVFVLATARDVTQSERRRIQRLPVRSLYESDEDDDE